ncbi:D-hexose-6-phosphate mutarotase [Lysobacter sp. CA196]|uniref:D-hexose-6-phosphate mutarotase n=1 Tax=Lysobacter sp. CA196 TaxID=3455606 RepID=UPI003F8D86D8
MAPDSNDAVTDALRLQVPGGVEIQATAFGAHAVSWQCQGQERLFLSPRASFGAGKAIRGGIPVIFPQFGGRGSGPRHGFARTCIWEVIPSPLAAPGLAFCLRDDENTRLHWPHRFEAELVLQPSDDRLRIGLTVRNVDSAPFEFTVALHTYLRVADIEGTLIHGLEDRPYLDSADGGKPVEATDAPVRFEGEVDRIYTGTHRPLRVTDGDQLLRLESTGFADTVVWNPGAALTASLNDLGGDQYRRFICVEAGNVLAPVHLEPQTAWEGVQTLIIEPRAGT